MTGFQFDRAGLDVDWRAAYRMAEQSGPGTLQGEVYRLRDELGLWSYHPKNPFTDARGWPDETIVGPAGALFRELKSQQGRLRPDQRDVGARLIRARLDWAVWRPIDLLNGTIAKQLREIA